jgi:hypothetical protein
LGDSEVLKWGECGSGFALLLVAFLAFAKRDCGILLCISK